MKRYIMFILAVIFIVVMSIGCTIGNNTIIEKDDGLDLTEQNIDDMDNKGDFPKEITVVPNKKATFNEAFSEEIITNPQLFLEQFVKGFKIGMLDENIILSLGEPDDIIFSQGSWGEESNWIYENVDNYQLTFIIVDNYLVNFEVSRYLESNGIIPKLTNKYKPVDEQPIEYKELGFEGVVLGLRVDEVLKQLNDPLKAYLTYDEMYGYNLAMIYKGITIYIILVTDNPHVQFIETNNRGEISTYRDISINSSVEDVISRYGPTEYSWETSDAIIYSTKDYWYAIKFEIDDGKVKAISIYNAS